MPTTISFNTNIDVVKIVVTGVANGVPFGKRLVQNFVPRNGDIVEDSTSTISDPKNEDI